MRRPLRVAGAFAVLLAAGPLLSAEPDARVAHVARLYRDFAWEVVVARPVAAGFMDQPRAVLERYLTPELAGLVLEDRACAVRTREVCRIEAAPLWGSSDPGATDLEVTAAGGNDVLVRFTYPGTDRKIALIHHLAPAGNRWRIDDIRQGSWSLKASLRRPM